jgi:ABC-type polysaccharide/polyol phosphate export permease
MGKIKILVSINIKLFFQKRLLVLATLLFPVLFYIFFSIIFTNYDDVSKIPVTVIDEDHTIVSIQVMDNLTSNMALKIVPADYKKAVKLLDNNRIEAIFILTKGFEDKIKQSDYTEAIQLVHLDKSAIGPALSDIIASEVMMSVAVYKAANESLLFETTHGYKELFKKTETKGLQLVEDSFFDMGVNSTVLTPRAQLEEEFDVSTLLKINTTLGYSLIVFSFSLMFSNGHLIDQWQLKKRLIMTGYKSIHFFISELSTIIITGILIVIIMIAITIMGLGLTNISTILTIATTLILHILFMSQLILVLTTVMKDKTKYQSIIAPIIFILGLLGGAFWSTELLSDSVIVIAKLSPIYWSLELIKNSMLQQVHSSSILLNYLIFVVMMLPITFIIYRFNISKLSNP